MADTVLQQRLRSIAILIACLIVRAPVAAAAVAESAPHSDWLAYAPPDTALFVEFRDLVRVRQQFVRLGIWQAVQALGDRTEQSAEQAAWQQEIQSRLGMTREEAVLRVLGRRCAVIAVDATRWKQGVVLAEPADEGVIEELLKRWRARPTERVGEAQAYRLTRGGGLLLAQRGRVLLFGTTNDPGDLWRRTLQRLGGAASDSLAGDADVQAGLGGLAARWDALAIVRPSGADHRSIILTALRFESTRLEVDLLWRGARLDAPDASAGHRPLLQGMPAAPLLCWSGRVSPRNWVIEPRGDDLASRIGAAILRTARTLLGDAVVGAAAVERLGPAAAFTLHRLPAGGAGFAEPASTLIVEAREPPRAADDLARLMGLLAAYVNTQSARTGAGEAPLAIQSADVGGHRLRWLPIGRTLAAYTSCPYLQRLDVAWVQTDARLMISSSVELLRLWLEHDSDGGGADPLAIVERSVLGRIEVEPGRRRDWVYLRGADLAAMVQTWFDFARQTDVRMLRAEWWQERAHRRARESQRLGVALRGLEDEPRAAEVIEIEADSPARNVLRVGDRITAVEGEPLATSRPAREVAERFRIRGADERFELRLLRDGQELTVRVELPPLPVDPQLVFNPVQSLRPIVALCRRITTLAACSWTTGQDELRARAVVRWQPATPKYNR